MKFTIIAFCFLVTSHCVFADSSPAPRRSNQLLRFLAEQQGMRNLGLYSVIAKRCSRYMPESQKDGCKSAVKVMIGLLDYDIIFSDDKTFKSGEENWTPSSFVFVAFKKNLLSLLNHSKTTEFLNDLNQKLYEYVSGMKSRPNIWEVALSHYRTDYFAAMVMASLFQDTSPMKLHLAWLERSGTRGNSHFASNKELLSRVIDTINLILDSSEENYRALFYPAEIQRDLNRNIYHFYVPLFLSSALKMRGVHETYAFSAALMLTLSYEFITSSSDYRYLYFDPGSIDSTHKMKDIFGGYCGSNIGVRGMRFNKSFTVIRETFLRSTEDGVELLLRH